MSSRRTHDRPIGFGRNGERVANTPMRTLPPRRGGRTVGDQSARTFSENSQMSQMCENASSPRTASRLRNSGSKIISACRLSTTPLWRGTPNFVAKSLWMWAMGFIRPPPPPSGTRGAHSIGHTSACAPCIRRGHAARAGGRSRMIPPAAGCRAARSQS